MELSDLCDRLRIACAELEAAHDAEAWPARQLEWCAQAGVYRWFVPKEYGGWNWNDRQQLEGYLAISEACLTTAFVLTQWNAACKRIVLSENETLRRRWLPGMASGEIFATVGISHLTTSRQHLTAPVLTARQEPEHTWQLNGMSPWATGGSRADLIVVGATLHDQRQLLCAVPRDRPGVEASLGTNLIALSASQTGAVRFDNVTVQPDELIAGPTKNIMASAGGGAGGLQTSTLAIGLTHAAVKFLKAEAAGRPELEVVADKLARDAEILKAALLALADGGHDRTATKLREQANSLVLRATQAALVAAKGAGFVLGHPAGRWCREALFFLVWSCPQPVLAANLCEFAQV